jgi:hypothetical protein
VSALWGRASHARPQDEPFCTEAPETALSGARSPPAFEAAQPPRILLAPTYVSAYQPVKDEICTTVPV